MYYQIKNIFHKTAKKEKCQWLNFVKILCRLAEQKIINFSYRLKLKYIKK
jgi:hypothetical protein